jgi:hypothetical protein
VATGVSAAVEVFPVPPPPKIILVCPLLLGGAVSRGRVLVDGRRWFRVASGVGADMKPAPLVVLSLLI